MAVPKYLDPADGLWKPIGVPPHTHPGQTRIPGEVIAYAGATAPAGWLICDGSEHNTADYPALAAVLGDLYGTAAAGKFRLPDLRSRSITGAGGAATPTLGSTAGAATHGHAGVPLPAHDHGNTATAAAHTHSVPAVTSAANGSHAHSVNVASTTTSSAGSHSHSTDNNGGKVTVAFGSGSSPASTIHEHSVSSGGSHTHTVNPASVNSGTIGDHSHSVPGATSGSGGGHAHDTTAVSAGTPTVQASSSYHPVLGMNCIIYTGE